MQREMRSYFRIIGPISIDWSHSKHKHHLIIWNGKCQPQNSLLGIECNAQIRLTWNRSANSQCAWHIRLFGTHFSFCFVDFDRKVLNGDFTSFFSDWTLPFAKTKTNKQTHIHSLARSLITFVLIQFNSCMHSYKWDASTNALICSEFVFLSLLAVCLRE